MNTNWGSRIKHETSAYKNFLQSCDVVAASCRATQKYLSAKWRIPVEMIRNGWYNFPQVSFDNLFEQKENIILSVGRVGAKIKLTKRSDIILEAFAKIAAEFPDWSVRFVGNIHETFNLKAREFPRLYRRWDESRFLLTLFL